MTTFFLGGSLGTLFAGLGWNYAGWNGVCLAEAGFASLGMMVSIFKSSYQISLFLGDLDLFEP